MTHPPTPIYRPREYLSYSTLMDFIRCPRRYFYKKCGIQAKDEPAALIYGSAMHKAVPVLLSGGTLEAAILAFSSIWNPELDDPKHNLRCAMLSLAHFEHTHQPGKSLYKLLDPPKRPDTLIVSEDVADSEIVAIVDIDLRVPIYARIDGWCEHRDTKELFLWELKTMGRLTSSMFDSLEFDPQVLTYVLLARTFTDRPVRGVMYEGILKDTKKVENMTHPVIVQDHLVDGIATWLRFYGELLLACEDRVLEHRLQDPHSGNMLQDCGYDPATDFPQNFAGCSAKPLFYQPGSACEYMNLCRTQDWRSLLPYYEIKPEHKLVELTKSVT